MAQTVLDMNVRKVDREAKSFKWEVNYRPAAQRAIKEVLKEAIQAASSIKSQFGL